MSTNKLLTKSNELLDKIARLQLEASLFRCKTAVDRLFEGIGPNSEARIHAPEACECEGLEEKDILKWNVHVDGTYAYFNRQFYDISYTYFSIRRADGNHLSWDTLLDSNYQPID